MVKFLLKDNNANSLTSTYNVSLKVIHAVAEAAAASNSTATNTTDSSLTKSSNIS